MCVRSALNLSTFKAFCHEVLQEVEEIAYTLESLRFIPFLLNNDCNIRQGPHYNSHPCRNALVLTPRALGKVCS